LARPCEGSIRGERRKRKQNPLSSSTERPYANEILEWRQGQRTNKRSQGERRIESHAECCIKIKPTRAGKAFSERGKRKGREGAMSGRR